MAQISFSDILYVRLPLCRLMYHSLEQGIQIEAQERFSSIGVTPKSVNHKNSQDHWGQD
jgi:hypothetical protein